MRMNCRTSLKMAERSPPSATYAATASEETMMEKFRSQPSTTFITSAMANIFTPLISTVMKAKEKAATTLAPCP